jgi:lipopolysaccharide export system permease protein
MRPPSQIDSESLSKLLRAVVSKLRYLRVRRIRLAPAGWHTRYMLRSYFRYTLMVTSGLLLVALTIDLAPGLTYILESRPDAAGLQAVPLVAWYLVLRSADILAKNLPLTIYLAILWCELAHTYSSERIAVGVSGRSPLQCLTPALVLGVIFGCFQLTLDLWLRPAAVMEQSREHLGNFGERFDRRPTPTIRWIKFGNDLVSARIDYGPPPSLRDVTLYRLEFDGQPHEVAIAKTAVPGTSPSTWVLADGFYWDWIKNQTLPTATGGSQASAEPSAAHEFALREISLDLDPLWLSNLNIDGKYLPQPILQSLASSNSPGVPTSDFRTWLQVRYARGLYVLGMVLLAASLGQIALYRLPPLYSLLGMVLAGYFTTVAVKVFEILGEQGAVPPIIAGWLIPVLLICCAAIVQLRVSNRVS